jgi:hypothetical protein
VTSSKKGNWRTRQGSMHSATCCAHWSDDIIKTTNRWLKSFCDLIRTEARLQTVSHSSLTRQSAESART